jgi:hypothetical protein
MCGRRILENRIEFIYFLRPNLHALELDSFTLYVIMLYLQKKEKRNNEVQLKRKDRFLLNLS